MSNHDEPRGLDRRAFLQLMGAAGLAAAMPSAAHALVPPATPTPADSTAHPAAPAAPGANEAKGPSEDAKALASVLRRRFPGRLTETEWASVTDDLDGRLALGKRLRATTLANSVEPDTTFKA